jgi:hypothetical protein
MSPQQNQTPTANRAYRLEVDLHREPRWSSSILQRRYSMPNFYTRWPSDDASESATPIVIEGDTLREASVAQDTPAAEPCVLSPAPINEPFDAIAPFTPFACQHIYPLLAGGKEFATLTVLSRANRTEARPLLCDGDFVMGWITIPGDAVSKIRRIELAVRPHAFFVVFMSDDGV